jgi:hypothetical protein
VRVAARERLRDGELIQISAPTPSPASDASTIKHNAAAWSPLRVGTSGIATIEPRKCQNGICNAGYAPTGRTGDGGRRLQDAAAGGRRIVYRGEP